MDDKCIHILLKGPRKGERYNKIAWFPFFFRCFCKQHAEMNNVPITKNDINVFIQQNSQ